MEGEHDMKWTSIGVDREVRERLADMQESPNAFLRRLFKLPKGRPRGRPKNLAKEKKDEKKPKISQAKEAPQESTPPLAAHDAPCSHE
jgi:hypothetical protein